MVYSSRSDYNTLMKMIRKTFFTLLLLVLTLQAQEWQIKSGVGMWFYNAQGEINHHGNVDLFDLIKLDTTLIDTTDEISHSSAYLYISLYHSMIWLPNLRFEYVKVRADGKIAYLSTPSSYDFEQGKTLTTSTQLTLAQYDTTLFYNLLKNKTPLSLDIGVDLKYIKSQYRVDTLYVDTTSQSLVPMLYINGSFKLPETGFGFDTNARYITDMESTLYDLRTAVNYTWTLKKNVNAGVDLGYRLERFQVVGKNSQFLGDLFSGKSDMDISFSGFYGGASLTF